jgi:uracil DNA glycosylase superfamily protein
LKVSVESMKTQQAKLKSVRELNGSDARASIPRERLRKRYRPDRVRILFVGEAPPSSGRFFYQADSGLYRAVRDTFISAFPSLQNGPFLESFRALGCYLVDLCRRPVDHMDRNARQRNCRAGEASLNRTLRQLRPKIVVVVVRSISRNVRRAEEQAKWSGLHVDLPYPGQWVQHRAEFRRKLVPLLRKRASSVPEV